MENLIQKIQSLDWEELEFDNEITIRETDLVLLSSENGIAVLRLLDKRESDEGEITFENSYNNLLRIEFPINFPAENILTNKLKLRHYARFNEVFGFNNNSIECINITSETDTFEVNNNSLFISFIDFVGSP